MKFFLKYMVNRAKMCFAVDHRTVKLVNLLVCLAWIISLIFNREVSAELSPTLLQTYGEEFNNPALWLIVFIATAIANLTAVTTKHTLSKHYAFLTAVILWTTIAVMTFMSSGFALPTFWIYSFLSLLSAKAYCSIDNSELRA